jgi:hypothetical protein
MAYLKVKIEELETKDLYRGINNFKKGYQPRTHIVKGDLFADCHSFFG